MKVTTEPSCRVGWPGETLHYVVRAQGATEVVALDNDMDGVQVRIASTQEVGDGVEAQIEVDVLDSTLY